MKTTLIAISVHSAITITLYFLLNRYGVFTAVPNQQNLLNWDANWYFSILSNGYVFVPNETCNLAFFPMFPYFWKVLGVDPVYMSLVNITIFFGSLHFLLEKYKLPVLSILILLSVPSLLFMGLPYSEALFFVFSTMILKGYETNRPNLHRIGFFFVTMIRSVSLIFIPAIVITELLAGDPRETISARIKKITPDVLCCLSGLMISSFTQYVQTGKWFYFLEVQKYWGRTWHIPHFPLTTFSPGRILELDAISFCMGTLALFFLMRKAFEFFSGEASGAAQEWRKEAPLIFSCLYITGTTILDVCFSQSYKEITSISSLNRHLLCTPFALIVIIYLIRDLESRNYSVMFYAIIPLICFYLTGVFRYYTALFYVAFFANVAIMRYLPRLRFVPWLFYLISMALQLYLYHDFLLFKWIG